MVQIENKPYIPSIQTTWTLLKIPRKLFGGGEQLL